MNFQQTWLYWLAGVVLLVVAVMSWRDKANPRRLTTGLFWGLYGVVFLFGDWTYALVGDKRLVNIGVGVVVVVLALIAGFGACVSVVITSARRKNAAPAPRASAIGCFSRRWRSR